MRILVVEDEPKMAGLLRRGLVEEGYAVDVAANGTDGLWAAAENPYDVMVLDLMLPDVPGMDVCRQLRERAFGCPCSCSLLGTPCPIGWRASTPARMTTSRSRSRSASCSRVCGRSRVAARQSGRLCSESGTWRSIRPPE